MEDMLQVGAIASTHGLRGEVKVFPTTDDVLRFKELKSVCLDTGKEMLTLEITGVKFFKNLVILKFRGIDRIQEVEKYRGKKLFVTRQDAVPLGKDEYFAADLPGLLVYDEKDVQIGTLKEVLPTGANDVYVVEVLPTYGEVSKQTLLLPAIKECILSVDIENAKMCVHIMDGLLDL